MLVGVIDSGTTNSRVYLVEHTGRVLARTARKVGVRDTAIHGSNAVLRDGLQEAFLDALQQASLRPDQIAFVIASGMITSELGLLEVPHLWAPAGIEELSAGLHCIRDTAVLPLDLPVCFVRGIKNHYDPDSVRTQDVSGFDFMRGEEAQVIGLLAEGNLQLPLTVVILSSHTKFVAVDEHQRIQGSVTTLSGQLYEAIVKETSIGKSIKPPNGESDEKAVDFAIVDLAYQTVMESGLLRSLLIPRFLDTLLETSWQERKLYVEAAIAAEDLRAIAQYDALGFPRGADTVLVGTQRRCQIYAYLFRVALGFQQTIKTITSEEEVARLSVVGNLRIAEKAGLLQ